MRASDIVWAVRYEMARTLDDVLARRSRSLFLDTRATMAIAGETARLMADELGRDEDWVRQQEREFSEIARHFMPPEL